jgi:hypothetical protein
MITPIKCRRRHCSIRSHYQAHISFGKFLQLPDSIISLEEGVLYNEKYLIQSYMDFETAKQVSLLDLNLVLDAICDFPRNWMTKLVYTYAFLNLPVVEYMIRHESVQFVLDHYDDYKNIKTELNSGGFPLHICDLLNDVIVLEFAERIPYLWHCFIQQGIQQRVGRTKNSDCVMSEFKEHVVDADNMFSEVLDFL